MEDVGQRPMQPVEIVGGEEERYVVAVDQWREEIIFRNSFTSVAAAIADIIG